MVKCTIYVIQQDTQCFMIKFIHNMLSYQMSWINLIIKHCVSCWITYILQGDTWSIQYQVKCTSALMSQFFVVCEMLETVTKLQPWKCSEILGALHQWTNISQIFKMIAYHLVQRQAVQGGRGALIIWHVKNYSPIDTVSHPRRLESSATLLWETQNSCSFS